MTDLASDPAPPVPAPPVSALYLVDGSGFIFRAFHALPPMTRSDGTPVNAVLGFANMLVKLIDDNAAHRLAVVFDAGRTSFRNDIYPEYKAHRPDAPPELIPQFALIRDAVRAFNLPCIEIDGYEADDLIATYARVACERGDRVVIVSSDKDMMQLIRDGVEMLDPIKNRPIGPPEVFEKFGVVPGKVIEVQALCGDSVDNVPGVPGIGPKTAAELIGLYGDVETLLRHLDDIKQPKRRETLIANAEQARISRELVILRDDVPLPLAYEELAKRAVDPLVLRDFLGQMEFRTLLNRFDTGQILHGKTKPGVAPAPAASAVSDPWPEPSTGGNYVLIQEIAELETWIARAFAAGAVALDTETSSLDPLTADLVGFSLAIEPGEAAYVPLGHRAAGVAGSVVGGLDFGGIEKPRQIPYDQAIAALAPLLAHPGVLKIGHNLKFDIQVLGQHGLSLTPIDDTMLLSYALEAGLHGHGMDELALLYLNYRTITYDQITGTGKARISFADVPLDKACDYAAEDADITLRLHRLLRPRLTTERATTIYETIDRPLVPIVVDMERKGVKIDRQGLKRLSGEFAQRLGVLEEDIHRLAGRKFNVGSPKQLGPILFDEHKLPGGRRGKNGEYSTDSGVLEPLAEAGSDLAARVLDWRQLAKLKSTYADSLVEQIDTRTGRIHTSFSLALTTTGRLSSTDPNLQNIPVRTEEGRKIRANFIAEEGYRLLSVDYSQVELRLLAEIADIATLKDAFRNGIDIHALTASQVFNIPLDQLDRETRRKAKAINFGIIYGISGFGLAKQLGCGPGEANEYIKAYFERYPGIRDYMANTREEARAQGFVRTLFGRKCHVAGILDKNPARRGFAERQAINAPIQGSAADIIKRAMLRVPAALATAKLGAAMLLQVHDELLFEVPEAEIDATAAEVRRVMEGAVDLSVPLVAEWGAGLTWDQAH